MSTLLTTYLGKYIDDLASFVISQYRTVNGLHDYRKVLSSPNSSVLAPNYTRNYLIHPYAIRQATPNIKSIPPLPSQLQFMFDDITFQKITTLVWSATATFVLAFTARFISSRLHPQLNYNDENDPLQQPSSSKHHSSSRSGSSTKAALISHQGKCMCGRVKFRVKAPSELHAILTDDFHPVTFPRIQVLCDDFVWLADAEAVNMVIDNSGDEHSGMHFLCVECSVEVLFSPTVDGTTLEVNLECIDTTHVTRIHHHHISTVPPTPEPQSFRQKLQFLQEQQLHKQQQQPIETSHPLEMTQQHNSSPSVSNASKTTTPKQSQDSYPSWTVEQIIYNDDVIKTPTPTTTRSVHSIHTLDHGGDDGFYDDEDDEDEDVSPSHGNHQHFALNMQLNSLGHYSRNKYSHSEHCRRSDISPHAANQSHGNNRQKYNGVFFSSNNNSSHNLHHTNNHHHYSRPHFAHHQHGLEGSSSAQDSDTTEEMVFEQFFAPAAPFSPPAAATTTNKHNSVYYSDELQYILGADPATANTVLEILASQAPSVTHTPPRVTPNKTYRPISTSDFVHGNTSNPTQPREGTPTSLESASSHGIQSHSRSHSGTSSPASSLGSNSASGGGTRRFYNYHHAPDESHSRQYSSHHRHLPDQHDVVSSPMSAYRKRGGRTLAFTTSPMLVSEVREQQQSPAALPLLRDEYGNELDIHENSMWFTSAMDDIVSSHQQQQQQQHHNPISQPFLQPSPQYNYQYETPAFTSTSSLVFPMEVSSLPTEHTSHSTHSDDMSSSTTPSTTQCGDLTYKVENEPVVEEDPSRRFPHVVDDQPLDEEDDNSPSGLWQRRHITMRRSTPGRLHTSSGGSSGYYHQHSCTAAGYKQRNSAAAAFGPSSVSMVDKHSAAAAGAPLDMTMYQNLKRYMGRHLSPSHKNNANKDNSVNSSDKKALL